MTLAPIMRLPKKKRQELLDDINYLNLAEIKSFCKRHSIPYRIAIEAKDGSRRITKDDDRKGIILNRVRHFLQTGVVLQETRFPPSVVCFDPLSENLRADDRLHYGQFDKSNRQLIELLKALTNGHFKNGAIARIVAREFWANGEAPTLKSFAAAWMHASQGHTRPNPEWAFLSDRANGADTANWKKLRARKASQVLSILSQIPTSD